MKTTIVAIVIVALGAFGMSLAAASAAQQPTDPEGVLRAIVNAFNAGDAATVASYFAEDATATGFFCPPAGVCHGRAEIQGQLEREIAEGAQDEITSLSVNGNVVTAQVTESAPGFSEIGIQRVVVTVTATVEEGLVTLLTDELDLSDSQTATFAQALKQAEEPAGVPSTGTGYVREAHKSSWTVVLAMLLTGLALVTTGGALRRKFARRRG